MAEFFDKFIEGVAKTTTKVSKKIDKTIDETSVKFEIGKKKAVLETLYCELGTLVSQKRDELATEEVASNIQTLYGKIDEINRDISNLNEKINPKNDS